MWKGSPEGKGACSSTLFDSCPMGLLVAVMAFLRTSKGCSEGLRSALWAQDATCVIEDRWQCLLRSKLLQELRYPPQALLQTSEDALKAAKCCDWHKDASSPMQHRYTIYIPFLIFYSTLLLLFGIPSTSSSIPSVVITFNLAFLSIIAQSYIPARLYP